MSSSFKLTLLNGEVTAVVLDDNCGGDEEAEIRDTGRESGCDGVVGTTAATAFEFLVAVSFTIAIVAAVNVVVCVCCF